VDARDGSRSAFAAHGDTATIGAVGKNKWCTDYGTEGQKGCDRSDRNKIPRGFHGSSFPVEKTAYFRRIVLAVFRSADIAEIRIDARKGVRQRCGTGSIDAVVASPGGGVASTARVVKPLTTPPAAAFADVLFALLLRPWWCSFGRRCQKTSAAAGLAATGDVVDDQTVLSTKIVVLGTAKTYATRMAAVFVISLATIWSKSGLMPRHWSC
jgi:hypothetical protein